MNIKGIFERNRIRKMFGKYIDKETINEVINNPSILSKNKIITDCGYVIIDISQDEYFEDSLKILIDYAYDNNIVYNIMGSIVFLNTYSFRNNDSIKIYDFIKKIPNEIKNKTREVFGIISAQIGNYGTNKQMVYMPLISKFYKRILIIDKLNYGIFEKNEEN